MEDIRDIVYEVIDEMGIYVDTEEEDFDLSEYIVNSLQFLTFVLNLEERLGIEIPDDLLLYDKMYSFNGYCRMLSDICKGDYKNDII